MKLERVGDYMGLKQFVLRDLIHFDRLKVLFDDGSVEGRVHISISHPKRYPTWDEIKFVRYELGPKDKDMVMYFPPMEEYVNIHPNCFHLYGPEDE